MLRGVVNFVVLVMLVVSPGLVRAQNPQYELAQKVVEASGQIAAMEVSIAEGFSVTITPVAEQLRNMMGECANPIVDRLQGEVADLLTAILTTEEVVAEITSLYADSFTRAELEQLLGWYESPLGKKIYALTPDLTRSSAAIGGRVMVQAMPTFQQKVQETVMNASIEAQQCSASRS
jgi:hypothetical protein